MDIGTFRFGPFVLNPRARQLLRDGHPLHLSPKAFDLLTLLVARRAEVVSKADIHRHLWPDTFVSEVNLAVLVAEIRHALGETARAPRFVRTVHRHGYGFNACPDSEHGVATASCWLVWSSWRAILRPGPNIVGRDEHADICLDALGVSCRHALILVTTEAATIEDLSSTHGTWVQGVRITSPVALEDGAEIRMGAVPMVFRRGAGGASTQTVA